MLKNKKIFIENIVSHKNRYIKGLQYLYQLIRI